MRRNYIKSEGGKRNMDERIAIYFPALSMRDHALLVGAVFRQALIEVGYSPDYHIYNLDSSFLFRHQEKASAKFLLMVRDFYRSLPDYEKRIFVCEYLEAGRHYPYWWLEYMDFRGFSKRSHDVLAKASKTF